tara:strand:+ start:1077 stop:1742 length:666 start_codon:yes stop_codon:yes gene_type:complete
MSSVYHTPTNTPVYNSYYNTYSNPHTISSVNGSNPFTYTNYNSTESQYYLSNINNINNPNKQYMVISKVVNVHKDDMGYIIGTHKRNLYNISDQIYPFAELKFKKMPNDSNTYIFRITGRTHEVNIGIEKLLRIKENLHEKQRYYYNIYKHHYEDSCFTTEPNSDWDKPSPQWLDDDKYTENIKELEKNIETIPKIIENLYYCYEYGINNNDPYNLSFTMA